MQFILLCDELFTWGHFCGRNLILGRLGPTWTIAKHYSLVWQYEQGPIVKILIFVKSELYIDGLYLYMKLNLDFGAIGTSRIPVRVAGIRVRVTGTSGRGLTKRAVLHENCDLGL